MVAAVHVRQEYASVQQQSQHFLPHQTYPTRDINVTMEIWVTVQKYIMILDIKMYLLHLLT